MKRTHQINIRVSTEEYESISQVAESAGSSVSEVVRTILLVTAGKSDRFVKAVSKALTLGKQLKKD